GVERSRGDAGLQAELRPRLHREGADARRGPPALSGGGGGQPQARLGRTLRNDAGPSSGAGRGEGSSGFFPGQRIQRPRCDALPRHRPHPGGPDPARPKRSGGCGVAGLRPFRRRPPPSRDRGAVRRGRWGTLRVRLPTFRATPDSLENGHFRMIVTVGREVYTWAGGNSKLEILARTACRGGRWQERAGRWPRRRGARGWAYWIGTSGMRIVPGATGRSV